jgi:hypothetical protein
MRMKKPLSTLRLWLVVITRTILGKKQNALGLKETYITLPSLVNVFLIEKLL